MKVLFRPSYEEHVAFLANRQREQQSKSNNHITWIFFSFNLGVVPAMLFLMDKELWALGVFVFNAVMLIFLLAWQQKTSLRAYYEKVWPELEVHDCEIDLSDSGVSCEHAGNQNFYPWNNVRFVGENDQIIYFDVGPTQLLASKRGFTTTAEARAFFDLARKLQSARIDNK